MMQIDWAFDGGTACDVEHIDERTVRCAPFTRESGTQHFVCCVRVTGVPADGSGRLVLAWPPRWTDVDVPVGWEAEFARRATAPDSFVRVLDRCCVFSPDGESWRPIGGISIDAEAEGAVVPVPGEGWVATQMPYTWARYQALLNWAERDVRIEVTVLERSRAGLPLHALTLPARDPNAPTVFVQALQHATEFTGPWVADHMLRWLRSSEGQDAASKMTWQFLPVLDVDALRFGSGYLWGPRPRAAPRARNPNRDWHEGTWPEVAAVSRFLQRQVASGRRYALGLDLHNGWDRAGTSGACYTVFPEGAADDGYRSRQHAWADWMYGRTDHAKPGQYWAHDTGGRGFAAFFHRLTGALAHTVEFSRHLWWDRRLGRHVPVRPDHPARYAEDAARAIAGFFQDGG